MSKYLILIAMLVGLGACRNEMHDQPKMKPYRSSAVFDDSLSMRPLVEGTVARGFLRADPAYDQGKTIDASGKGSDVKTFPYPITRAMLDRGQERFNIYCSPCHGLSGAGDGMVVRRGFPPPPNFSTDTGLLAAAPGHFFDVITNGFGVMPDYAMQLDPADRWAVVAYVKALQTSQHSSASALNAQQRAALDRPKPTSTPITKPE
jgi:mono/diheme cytochrome c family protein